MDNAISRNLGRIALVCLAIVAVTTLVAFAITSGAKPDGHFAIALLPVLGAEIWIGCSVAAVALAPKEAFPRGAAKAAVPIYYFLFTLCAAGIGVWIESNLGFLALQAVGLVIAVAVAVGAAMASDASAADERALKAEVAPRKDWKLSMDRAAMEAKSSLGGNANVAKAIAKAADKARYAASSLPGRADLDSPVTSAAESVLSAVRAADADAVCIAVEAFIRQIDFREKAVKAAR